MLALRSHFVSANVYPAVVVYDRPAGVTAADKAKATADARRFAGVAGVVQGQVAGPFVARDGKAIETLVPVNLGHNGWMRTPTAEPELAAALTAYATDLTLIGTALRAVDGVSQRDAGTAFTSAVTSHTLWFHRPFVTDDWLLLRQHSPLLAHGRCFGHGDVLTADGSLVASYAQESLVRFAS